MLAIPEDFDGNIFKNNKIFQKLNICSEIWYGSTIKVCMKWPNWGHFSHFGEWHFGCTNQTSKTTFQHKLTPKTPLKDTSGTQIRPQKWFWQFCVLLLWIFLPHFPFSIGQGGTICGAIEESSISFKSINKRVFINFHNKYAVFTNFGDKNAVFTCFCDKNDVFEVHVHDKNTVFGFNFVCSG